MVTSYIVDMLDLGGGRKEKRLIFITERNEGESEQGLSLAAIARAALKEFPGVPIDRIEVRAGNRVCGGTEYHLRVSTSS